MAKRCNDSHSLGGKLAARYLRCYGSHRTGSLFLKCCGVFTNSFPSNLALLGNYYLTTTTFFRPLLPLEAQPLRKSSSRVVLTACLPSQSGLGPQFRNIRREKKVPKDIFCKKTISVPSRRQLATRSCSIVHCTLRGHGS